VRAAIFRVFSRSISSRRFLRLTKVRFRAPVPRPDREARRQNASTTHVRSVSNFRELGLSTFREICLQSMA
jgi:hypothetical protein